MVPGAETVVRYLDRISVKPPVDNDSERKNMAVRVEQLKRERTFRGTLA